MKTFILTLITISCLGHCSGQETEYELIRNSCCAKVKYESPYIHYHLVDVILNKIDTNMVRFISRRHTLRTLHVLARDRNVARFESRIDDEIIRVELNQNAISLTDHNIINLTYEGYSIKDSVVESINGKKPYGIVAATDSIYQIERFDVVWGDRRFDLAEETNDLISINFTSEYLSIRPLEVFLSDDSNFLYVYLFGFDENNILVSDPNVVLNTYMAKIIVGRHQGFMGRIVVDGTTLYDYNWMCKDFIGF